MLNCQREESTKGHIFNPPSRESRPSNLDADISSNAPEVDVVFVEID